MRQSNWAFVGQNEMGASALEELIFRLGQPRYAFTRGAKPTHTNRVEEVAARSRLRLTHAPDHRLEVAEDALSTCDLLVCCGWARRIPSRLFSLPRFGTINLHPGSLPSWSGSDPLGWCRAAGAQEIEVTIHRMTDVIDAGQVLATAVFSVGESDTGHDLRRRAGRALGRLAVRVIEGGLKPMSCTPSIITRATPPRGVTPAIDPLLMLRSDVERIVRAFSPYPGVLAKLDGSWCLIRVTTSEEGAARSLRCADGWVWVEKAIGY